MMPMTPMGTRTREISMPLGLVHWLITVPTGSGRAAISSSPLAMASMRSGVSVRRSTKLVFRFLDFAASRSLAFSAAYVRGTAPDLCGHGTQGFVLLVG